MATSITYDRHIIVVGKLGSGKSTVGNHIMKSNVFPVKSGVESDTPKALCNTGIINHECSNYEVILIEAPGFCNTRNINNSILEGVKSTIKSYAPNGLNLVLFVRKEGRFTEEEDVIFSSIIDNLRDRIEAISALVITCCENKNPTAREKVVETFRTASTTARYASFMKKGIYTVGFPDLSEMDEQEAIKMENRMKKDEEQLMDLIAQAATKSLREEMQQVEPNWIKIINCFVRN